ncbi:hypothetical protein ACQPZX_03380 [Actinoplanes sp. CA-142083]|uniref:hypothetical protein n=1 Tax=Actinoplanes sp. CA-142083 TaxID=3239903 RepID=UPI003D93005F
MPDGSPPDGSASAPDQPTTELNRLWNRPAAASASRAGGGWTLRDRHDPGGGEQRPGPTFGGSAGAGKSGPSAGAGKSGPSAGSGKSGPSAGSGKSGPSAGEGKSEPTPGTEKSAGTSEPTAGAGVGKPAAGTGTREPTAGANEDDVTAGREQDGASETITAGDRAGFRLAAFGALLVVVLFAGYGIGRLNNATTSASAPPAGAATGTTNSGTANGGTADGGGAMPGMVMDENQPHTHNNDGTVAQGGGATTSVGASVGGLSLSSGGLTLVPTQTNFVAGRRQRLSFRITGAGGAPITTYAVVHDKLLHLIVIRRDLSGFQHLHPSMGADGSWGIDLMLAQPGIYRMIADFTALVGGKPVATTLGSDLTVAGDYAPTALPAPAHAVAADGFAVGYEGTPDVQSTQPILVSVAGPDRRPAMLEPYLGAYGHLVVLRDGDLAYVHVHPETTLADGKVKFWLSVPSSGTYRMFFDFQVAGQVHTAAWTVEVR